MKPMIIEELSNRVNMVKCSRIGYSQCSYHKGIAALYQTILWALRIKRAYPSRMKTWPHDPVPPPTLPDSTFGLERGN
jgi:hypothetical protein